MSRLHLFSLEASRSIRVAWCMEELGLEYKNTSYPRVNNKAPPEYAKESRSSLGKAPVLHDGDLVLVESGAICGYLQEKYDPGNRLLSTEPKQRAETRMWVHASEGQFMLHALAITYARWGATEDVQQNGLQQMQNFMSINVKRDLHWLEETLSKGSGQYIVGDSVTLADIMMGFSIDFIFTRKLGVQDYGEFPGIKAWLDGLLQRQAYKAAVKKTDFAL